ALPQSGTGFALAACGHALGRAVVRLHPPGLDRLPPFAVVLPVVDSGGLTLQQRLNIAGGPSDRLGDRLDRDAGQQPTVDLLGEVRGGTVGSAAQVPLHADQVEQTLVTGFGHHLPPPCSSTSCRSASYISAGPIR